MISKVGYVWCMGLLMKIGSRPLLMNCMIFVVRKIFLSLLEEILIWLDIKKIRVMDVWISNGVTDSMIG
jgi:hypothetical protein